MSENENNYCKLTIEDFSKAKKLLEESLNEPRQTLFDSFILSGLTLEEFIKTLQEPPDEKLMELLR